MSYPAPAPTQPELAAETPVEVAAQAVITPTVVTPIVAPDISPAVLADVETAVTKAVGPFIPAKVRAAIYTATGIIVVIAPPLAHILGGEVGLVLTDVAGAAAVASSVLALSHVTK